MRKGRGSKEREREMWGVEGEGEAEKRGSPPHWCSNGGEGVWLVKHSCRNSSGAILGIIPDGRGIILGLAKKFIN